VKEAELTSLSRVTPPGRPEFQPARRMVRWSPTTLVQHRPLGPAPLVRRSADGGARPRALSEPAPRGTCHRQRCASAQVLDITCANLLSSWRPPSRRVAAAGDLARGRASVARGSPSGPCEAHRREGTRDSTSTPGRWRRSTRATGRRTSTAIRPPCWSLPAQAREDDSPCRFGYRRAVAGRSRKRLERKETPPS